MAALTSRQRDKLPPSAFAFPEERKLPIDSADRVRSALGRFRSTLFPTMAARKRAAVRIVRGARRFGIALGDDTVVARAAGVTPAGRRSGETGRKPGSRRNPGGKPASPGGRVLEAARRLARGFHGTDAGQVVELSPGERAPLSRYVVVAGELDDFTYRPSPTSKRGNARWRHESGDRGALRPRAKKKPLLVVDPLTRRPAVVANGSPMRFSEKGFVG